MSPSTDDIRRDDQLLDLLGRRRPVSRDDPAALLLSAWSLEIDAGLPRRAPVARRSGRALGIVLSLLLTVGGGSVAAALSGTQLPVLTTVGSALIGWVPGVQLPEVEDAGAKGSTVTVQALDTRSPAASEVRPPSVLTGADHAGSADLLVAGALIGMNPLGPTTDAASVVPPPAGSVLSPPAEAAAGSAGQTSDAVGADTTSKPRHTGAPDKADKATRTARETTRDRPDKSTPRATTSPPATTGSPGKATPPRGTGRPATPPGQVDRPDKTRPTDRSGPPTDRGPGKTETGNQP